MSRLNVECGCCHITLVDIDVLNRTFVMSVSSVYTASSTFVLMLYVTALVHTVVHGTGTHTWRVHHLCQGRPFDECRVCCVTSPVRHVPSRDLSLSTECCLVTRRRGRTGLCCCLRELCMCSAWQLVPLETPACLRVVVSFLRFSPLMPDWFQTSLV